MACYLRCCDKMWAGRIVLGPCPPELLADKEGDGTFSDSLMSRQTRHQKDFRVENKMSLSAGYWPGLQKRLETKHVRVQMQLEGFDAQSTRVQRIRCGVSPFNICHEEVASYITQHLKKTKIPVYCQRAEVSQNMSESPNSKVVVFASRSLGYGLRSIKSWFTCCFCCPTSLLPRSTWLQICLKSRTFGLQQRSRASPLSDCTAYQFTLRCILKGTKRR